MVLVGFLSLGVGTVYAIGAGRALALEGDPIPGIDLNIEDADGDGYGDPSRNAEPGLQVAPSQTKVLTPVGTEDSDDDGYGDAIREGGKTIDAGSVPETNAASGYGEEYSDLPGVTIDYLDDDSDDDGIEDGVETNNNLSPEDYPYRIQVQGSEVRGWDPETKEAVRTRLAEAGNESDADDLGFFVALQAVDNEAITDISIDEERTTVAYKTTLSVFGFIPIQTIAETSAENGGEIKTAYPWWRFLARRSSEDDTYANIASNISARIAITEEGVPAVDEKHN